MAKRETLKIGKEFNLQHHHVYAVTSAEGELKVCLELNKSFDIQLTIHDEIGIQRKGNSLSFRNYSYESDEEIEKIILINNRSGGALLFPELKNVDYLFIIIAETPSPYIQDSINQLKAQRIFTSFSKVDPTRLKNFSHLVEH